LKIVPKGISRGPYTDDGAIIMTLKSFLNFNASCSAISLFFHKMFLDLDLYHLRFFPAIELDGPAAA
jgi:hypothetical protein